MNQPLGMIGHAPAAPPAGEPNPVASALRNARRAFLNRVPNAMQRVNEQLDQEAEARAKPMRAYNDAQAARLAGKAALIDQNIAARRALSDRNVSNYRKISDSPVSLPSGHLGETVPAGSITPAGMAARNLRNEMALQPGGMDRLRRMQALNAAQAAPAQEAAAPPPAALAMGHARGMSEVGRGLDPQMASRIQAGFAARAARMGRGGDVYDRRAKESADAIAAGLKKRPTRESINRARYEQRLADMARINMMHAAPYIALAQAQHGENPAQMAQANYHNAMADAIRQQMAGEANGAAKSSEPLPPGHIQLGPGVVRRPQSWWEKIYGNAVANGSWFPQGMSPPVMIGQPGF